MGKDMAREYFYMRMFEYMKVAGNATINMGKDFRNFPTAAHIKETM